MTLFHFPTTVAADFVRHVGLSDIYSLHGAHPVTMSVDKRGGLYQGRLVTTTDDLPTKKSVWAGISADDTNDVTDLAVPTTAKHVAFLCSAITDTASPVVGAKVSVTHANTNHLGRHNRQTFGSGDAEVIVLPVLPPSGFVIRYFPSDVSTLWQDTGRTMLVDADGQDINAIDGLGSLGGQNMDTLTGTDNAPQYVANAFTFGGTTFAGIEFDAANTEALRTPAGQAPDPTQGARILVVGQLLGVPSGIGYIATMADEEFGSLRADATNIISRGINSVVSQVFAHGGTPVVFAMWIDINIVATNLEISLNLVAGTDSTTKNITDPGVTHEWQLGNRSGSSFADNVRFLELVAWDETLGPPSTGDIEQYATDQYGIAWA